MVNPEYVDSDWCYATEAARIMQCSVATLKQWEKNGYIIVKRNDQNRRIYPRNRLEEIFSHCKRKGRQNYSKAAQTRKEPWIERRKRYGASGCRDGKMFGKKMPDG